MDDHLIFVFLPISDTALITFQPLEQALQAKECYQSVQMAEFAPHESTKRYEYMKKLKTCGLPFPCALVTYSHGNNIGKLNFIWRVDGKDESSFAKSQSEIERIKHMLPVFKTRAMRRAAFARFGRVTHKISSAAFNDMYKELTSHQSAATNTDQAEIEKGVKMIVDMEDVETVVDLRHLNGSRESDVMSILNLGLQSVGLMRKECTPSAEAVLKNCNSLKQIRTAVDSEPSLAEEIADSIEAVKMLIS